MDFDDDQYKLIIPTFNSKEFIQNSPLFSLSFRFEFLYWSEAVGLPAELSQDASNESASFAMRSLLLRRGHLFMTPLQDRQEHRFQRGIVLRIRSSTVRAETTQHLHTLLYDFFYISGCQNDLFRNKHLSFMT